MDSNAFRDLYDVYYPDVLRFVKSLVRSENDVDDIVQATFVKVARSYQGFRGGSQMRTWIFSIAKNTLLDFARQQARVDRMRHPDASTPDDRWQPPEPVSEDRWDDPEAALLHAEERGLIRACIDRLPVAMRAVLVCRLLSDLSVSETAAVMGWSAARVRVTHSRALRKFHDLWIAEEEDASHKSSNRPSIDACHR